MARVEHAADAHSIQESIRRHARYSLGKAWDNLTPRDRWTAVALSVRDRLVDGMLSTEERYSRAGAKRLSYLSMEYLIGRSLGQNLVNLGLRAAYEEALRGLGIDLNEVEETEVDAALGNGGLGRLAACFLDSLATLGIPAVGYGINYEYGLFKQEIDSGFQREKPDNWLASGSPWQIARPDEACLVPVHGRIEHGTPDRHGGYNPMWLDWDLLIGIPNDMLIPGYGGRTVNVLRLFSAHSSRDFDIQIFNEGDYVKAVEQKIASETVSKVLYPSDAAAPGRELRLVQEYFLVACAVRDLFRKFEQGGSPLRSFPSKVAIQLNDTHPALTIAELMRVLVDEKDLPWEEAWEITQASTSYTNHTLAPEALEAWPVPMLERMVPRHLQIIYEINRRLLAEVQRARPGDPERARRMALIDDAKPPQIRMTNLAIAGSHSVNGVSALHTELVKKVLVPELHELWPAKFNNKTNGVTPRMWLLGANPALAKLIRAAIGEGWITDLRRLRELEARASDAAFQGGLRGARRSNKEELAKIVKETSGVVVDLDSLFDIHVKRIHLYKRQLLKVMHVVHQYLSLLEEGRRPEVPRTYLFAGKAAPGYWAAKHVIKLIHNVARVINADRRASDCMRVAFIPDYRISLAQKIIPAADLGEQISTAGTEASGTSNMKFALNGAVIIGTWDGANAEIVEEIGEENAFIFGLRIPEVRAMRQQRGFHPRELYERDPRVRRVVDAFRSDLFCRDEPRLFAWIHQMLLDENDPYLHLADLPSYLDAQGRADAAFKDPNRWTRMAVLSIARMGRFSSDRAVEEYAREIWQVAAP
jgi:starch phosphorylase